MTTNTSTIAGVVLSTLALPGLENWIQLGGSLVGTGLLVWIIVRKERDCEALRQANHDLARELVSKCKECSLARAANDSLIEAGKEHFEK